jgi:salicylate hydroxylase
LFSVDPSIPIGSVEIPQEKWAVNVHGDEVSKDFEGWGPDVQIMIKYLNFPLKWSIHAVHPPLESFAKDSVALVGDAAHAMLP